MDEPSPRTSRLAIAAGLAVLIAIGSGGFMLGRATAPAPGPAPPSLRVPPSPPATAKPDGPVRLLARADLIELGNAAADATASGTDLPEALEKADGRRFQLYLPFGCDGPAANGSDELLRWRYDESEAVLRVHAAPVSWSPQAWWRKPPSGVELLEGFWIARPWSTLEYCARGDAAATPAGVDPVTLPGQTLGVAEVVTTETPRQLRRDGRPYEAVARIPPDALRLDAGLRLRLRGRITGFPEGKLVRCMQTGGRNQRPVCLIGVSLDEVAIENPSTQETLAVWVPTAPNAPPEDN